MTATRDWAVVTGASSGIGREFAELLASKGVNLIMASRSGAELTKEATALEKAHDIKTIIYAGDLTNQEEVEGLIRAVLEAKVRVRYVINSAGFGAHGAFIKSSWERELQMLQVNIEALTYLTKAFGSYMAKRGEGHILNLASTAAFFPGTGMAVYYATKAYVLSLSEAVAEELAGSGVTVTALCPGPTSTRFAETAEVTGSSLFKYARTTPEAVARYRVTGQ